MPDDIVLCNIENEHERGMIYCGRKKSKIKKENKLETIIEEDEDLDQDDGDQLRGQELLQEIQGGRSNPSEVLEVY